MIWRQRLAAALGLALAVWSGSAAAHAVVMEATPALDGHVAAGDVDVVIRFNSRIDASRSKLTLTGPDGANAEAPLPPAPLAGADRLTAVARALRPGLYRLHWRVLSVDGHITQGFIPFTVDP